VKKYIAVFTAAPHSYQVHTKVYVYVTYSLKVNSLCTGKLEGSFWI